MSLGSTGAKLASTNCGIWQLWCGEVALQVPPFSIGAASDTRGRASRVARRGDLKLSRLSDILPAMENPGLAWAAHETHVVTNTARSSATAPKVYHQAQGFEPSELIAEMP